MDGKRKHDVTDSIIAAALEEEAGRKRLKKQQPQNVGQPDSKRGLTQHEVEVFEGGAVKESLAGAAQEKRAVQRRRKGKAAGNDTDMLTHVEEAEELADRDQEDGVKLEPFNLAQERAEGHFDESGHYVENKPDDADENDAWLASEDAAVVSESVRQQILERQRRMAAAEDAPEMTLVQTAAVQRDIAALLLPGESVTKALQRLRPQKKGPAGKRAKDAQPKISQTPEEEQKARQQFEKLTESASLLMDSGELDVYSQKKEHFEKEAARFAAFDEEDDMFADDTENKAEQAATSAPSALPSLLSTPRASFTFPEVWSDSNSGTPRLNAASTSHNQAQNGQPQLQDGVSQLQDGQPQLQNGQPSLQDSIPQLQDGQPQVQDSIPQLQEGQPQLQDSTPQLQDAGTNGAASSSAPEAETNGHSKRATSGSAAQVDYNSWPVKELRRFLVEKGVDAAGLLEKSELAEKVKEVASQGPEGQPSTVPDGYAYDATSGYYFNSENQMYFDASTGGFYSGTDQKWYLFNESSQQFQPWEHAA